MRLPIALGHNKFGIPMYIRCLFWEDARYPSDVDWNALTDYSMPAQDLRASCYIEDVPIEAYPRCVETSDAFNLEQSLKLLWLPHLYISFGLTWLDWTGRPISKSVYQAGHVKDRDAIQCIFPKSASPLGSGVLGEPDTDVYLVDFKGTVVKTTLQELRNLYSQKSILFGNVNLVANTAGNWLHDDLGWHWSAADLREYQVGVLLTGTNFRNDSELLCVPEGTSEVNMTMLSPEVKSVACPEYCPVVEVKQRSTILESLCALRLPRFSSRVNVDLKRLDHVTDMEWIGARNVIIWRKDMAKFLFHARQFYGEHLIIQRASMVVETYMTLEDAPNLKEVRLPLGIDDNIVVVLSAPRLKRIYLYPSVIAPSLSVVCHLGHLTSFVALYIEPADANQCAAYTAATGVVPKVNVTLDGSASAYIRVHADEHVIIKRSEEFEGDSIE